MAKICVFFDKQMKTSTTFCYTQGKIIAHVFSFPYLIVVCSFQRTKLSAKTSNHIFNMIHAKYIVIPF